MHSLLLSLLLSLQLGVKGGNVAEMSLLGLPVPPGLTLTIDACTTIRENSACTVASMVTHCLHCLPSIGRGAD
jgi:pyruvate, orthophosphate dikinase